MRIFNLLERETRDIEAPLLGMASSDDCVATIWCRSESNWVRRG